MSLYGVGLNAEINNINTLIKLHIAKHKGDLTIRTLKQIFKDSDANGNGLLEAEEFEKCLAKFGFFLKKQQYQTLMRFYDANNDGHISFTEFTQKLREPLSERRLKLILKLYDFLDQNQQGYITEATVKEKFIGDNCKIFEQIERDSEGNVQRQEFIEFYEDLSVAVPSDSYFMEIIYKAWGVEEEEQSIISDQEIKNIVKILRQKLIQKTRGISDEFLLKRLFQEFDVNANGTLSVDELYAMTIKLEVPIAKKYLSALHRKFDKNGNGLIEFDEFLNFIIYEPYP